MQLRGTKIHNFDAHGYIASHFRTQLQLDVASGTKEGEELWVLLTRHVRNHRTKDEYVALTAHSGATGITAAGNEALYTKVS